MIFYMYIKKEEEKQLMPILIDHLFSLLLFLYDVGCKLMLTRIGQETNWLLKIGLNIFGSVRFWTKINNQTNFFFNFLNRTEPKTGSNQLISVRFFSLPNRFKPKLFQLVHSPKKSLIPTSKKATKNLPCLGILMLCAYN
jgi:hypothetical protein